MYLKKVTSEGTHHEHNVETTDFVGKKARNRSTEEGCCVQDTDEVLCQVGAHAVMSRLQNDVIDGNEHAQEEHERSEAHQSER